MSKAKKLKNINNKKAIPSSDNQLNKLIAIFISISVIFLIFYVVTLFVTDEKENVVEEEPEATTIQYTNILVGSILLQKESEYFVIATKEEDLDKTLYEAYISTYSGKEGALEVFYINLDNGFNKGYVGTTSNLMVTNISDIKFKEATLLHVKNGAILATYEGKTNITKFLKTKIS